MFFGDDEKEKKTSWLDRLNDTIDLTQRTGNSNSYDAFRWGDSQDVQKATGMSWFEASYHKDHFDRTGRLDTMSMNIFGHGSNEPENKTGLFGSSFALSTAFTAREEVEEPAIKDYGMQHYIPEPSHDNEYSEPYNAFDDHYNYNDEQDEIEPSFDYELDDPFNLHPDKLAQQFNRLPSDDPFSLHPKGKLRK